MQNLFAGSLDAGIGPFDLVARGGSGLLSRLPLLGLLALTAAFRTSSSTGRTLSALVPTALLFGTGLLAAWVATSVVLADSGTAHSVLARSFFLRADLFVFGMAVAVLMVNIEDGVVKLPRWGGRRRP